MQHGSSTDAEIRAAFKEYQWILNFVVAYRTDKGKETFLEERRKDLQRCDRRKGKAALRGGDAGPAGPSNPGPGPVPPVLPQEPVAPGKPVLPRKPVLPKKPVLPRKPVVPREPVVPVPVSPVRTTQPEATMDVDRPALLSPPAAPVVLLPGPADPVTPAHRVIRSAPAVVSSEASDEPSPPRLSRKDKGKWRKAVAEEGGNEGDDEEYPEHIVNAAPTSVRPPRQPVDQRREPAPSSELHDPPCNRCERTGNECLKDVNGGSCSRCKRMKEKCNYAGIDLVRAQQPKKRRRMPRTFNQKAQAGDREPARPPKRVPWVDVDTDEETSEPAAERGRPAPARVTPPASAPTGPADDQSPTPRPARYHSRIPTPATEFHDGGLTCKCFIVSACSSTYQQDLRGSSTAQTYP